VVVSIEFEDRTSTGELLDLSRSGIRLAVTDTFPQGASIRVKLKVACISRTLEVDAKVCWVSPGTAEGWILGCALKRELEEHWIVDLAVNSILERRRDGRDQIDLSGEFKSELGSEFALIQLVDYSAGGFAGRTMTGSVAPGERLMLRFAQEGKEIKCFRAKVIWTRPDTDGGQLLGCAYLTREDHVQLQTLVDPGIRDRWLRDMEAYRPTRWRMVAAAVFIMMSLQIVDLACHPQVVKTWQLSVSQQVEPWWNRVRQMFSAESVDAPARF
jgi:hypothetical protein